jgi:hypothetical protein
MARAVSHSPRGRALSRPQIEKRAAMMAAKLAGKAGDVVDVRL